MNFTKNKNKNNGRFESLLKSDSQTNNSRDNSRNYSRDNSRNYSRDNSRNFGERKPSLFPIPKKEYNIMGEDFPEIIVSESTNTKESQQPCLNYIEKCKLIKEESIKEKLKPGWICMKQHNNTNHLLYSKNGTDFVDNYEDLKTKQEKEKEEEIERELYNQRAFNICMELDNRRRQESMEYYEICGELDEYALAEIDRLKYEEYEKQFEIVESEEDSDEYVSD